MKQVAADRFEAHKSVMNEDFHEMFKGGQIANAVIHLAPYSWEGEFSSSPNKTLYRKFFYTNEGRVAKALGFDQLEHIEFKEENVFKDGQIRQKLVTTEEGVWLESYLYSGKKLEEYHYSKVTLGLDQDKVQKAFYSYDRYGRKSIKKFFGRSGFLEYVTEYVYPNTKTSNYSFRSITDGKGNLVITLIYTYDSKGKLTRLAELEMDYKAYNKLSNAKKEEALKKSKVISYYMYNSRGEMIRYIRTIPKGQVIDITSSFLGVGEFVITQEREYHRGTYKRRRYMLSIVEYDPKYREGSKVHLYRYFDKDNNEIVPK